MTAITFTVPGVPVGKGRHKSRINRSATSGKQFVQTYTPAATVAWEREVARCGLLALGDLPMFDGPIHIDLGVWVPVPVSYSKKKRAQALAGEIWPHTSKPDVDNVLKAVLDGLCKKTKTRAGAELPRVLSDDTRVVTGTFGKAYSASPRVDVRIVTKAAA